VLFPKVLFPKVLMVLINTSNTRLRVEVVAGVD
jgi:hypothetical protein